MSNNITTDDVNVIEELFRMRGIGNLLNNEESEWRTIILLQNTLSEADCYKYVSNLNKLGCSLVTATIEQRIESLIKVRK